MELSDDGTLQMTHGEKVTLALLVEDSTGSDPHRVELLTFRIGQSDDSVEITTQTNVLKIRTSSVVPGVKTHDVFRLDVSVSAVAMETQDR